MNNCSKGYSKFLNLSKQGCNFVVIIFTKLLVSKQSFECSDRILRSIRSNKNMKTIKCKNKKMNHFFLNWNFF